MNILSARAELLIKCLIVISVLSLFIASNCYSQDTKSEKEKKLTIKKINWLEKYGEKTWIGQPNNRTLKRACLLKENQALFYNSWGISKGLIQKEIIPCPNFFHQNK